MLFKETQPIFSVSFHLKEKQEDQHTKPNVEESAQDFKSSHHCPTVWVELRRSHIRVLKQSTLESSQGENKTQDLKQTPIHIEEGRTTRRRPQEREVISPASLNG